MEKLSAALHLAINSAKSLLKENWNKAQYLQGWQDGSTNPPLPRQMINSPSYNRGYDDAKTYR